MDNVTHGLIGLLVAEAALQVRFGSSSAPARFRTAALFCSIAGNNTPDLDFVYSGITEGKLGYLLHHRGHTHTFAAVLPMALLAILPVLIWAWRARPGWSRADWRFLGFLAVLAPICHIGMDAMNSYGVHPLWPVSNRWFYGDTLFIIEPLLILSIGLLLAPEARTRVGRGLLLLPPLIVLGLSWAVSMVSWPWAVALTLFALLLGFGAAPLGRRGRIGGAIGLTVGVMLLFAGARGLAAKQVRATLQEMSPGAALHDLVMTPLPANPRCWSFIAVQTEGADYLLRRGEVALVSDWLPVSECAQRDEPGTIAPLGPARGVSETPAVRWNGEFRAPLAQLRHLAATRCDAAALLRFARAPFFLEEPGGRVILGDLRYDRGEHLGFAALELAEEGAPCPRAVPPWRPPLADLL